MADNIFKEVEKSIEGKPETIGEAVEKVKDAIGDLNEKLVSEAKSKASGTVNSIKQGVGTVISGLTDKKDAQPADGEETETKKTETAKAETAVKPSQVADTAAGKVSEFVHSIGDAAAPIVEKTKSTVKDIAEKAAPAVDKIKDAAEHAVDEMKGTAKKATDYLYGIEKPFEAKNDLFRGLEAEVKQNLTDSKSKADELENMLDSMMDKDQASADDAEEPKPEETEE